MSVAGLDEVRQERLGAVDDAPEVDVHHPFDVLELGDLDVAGERDARVVVDLVDLAEVGLDGVGVEQERFAFGDVEAVGLDRGADRLEPFFGDRQALGVDVADRDVGARTSQLDRQRLTDARSGAGDDSDLPGEALHRTLPRLFYAC